MNRGQSRGTDPVFRKTARDGDRMIELYNRPTSTCSQKVRICLAEKGLDFIDTRVDNKTNQNLTPGYLALNPNGVVPSLPIKRLWQGH